MRKILTSVAAVAALAAGCASETGDGSTEVESDLAAVTSDDDIAVPDAYTAVVSGVLGAPTFPFKGTDGRYHVAYDLELQNTSATVPATIEKIDVVSADDPDDVITSISAERLVDEDCVHGDCDRLRNLRAAPTDDAVIPPQESRIVFIDFAFDELDDAPAAVLHHLYADAAAGPPSREPSPVDYLTTPYDISAGEPVSIGPPLTGNGWVALNGCCEPGFPHRSSPAPANGSIVNGQRFAIDWKQINDDGNFFVGNPDENESYVDYGSEVIAVGDGTVIGTLDTMDANRPGVLPAEDPVLAPQLTIETVDGNHVILDLGDGVYAVYAHLARGSLEVEVGDTVRKGETIAELGNTGNANASHLHFHLMDGASPLGSNGVPYVIDSFGYEGQVDPQLIIDTDDYLSGDFGGDRSAPPAPRSGELPLAWAIVDFSTD